MGTKIEETLRIAGDFGRWHWWVVYVAAISGLFWAWHGFALVYVGGIPDHWCRVEELKDAGWTTEEIKRAAIPSRMELGVEIYDQCKMYERNYTELAMMDPSVVERHPDDPLVDCQHWDHDTTTFQSTIATEWELFCSRLHILSTIHSLAAFGVLVGSLFIGTLSDKYGRRICALVSTILMTIAALASIFAVDPAMMGSIRFILGCMAYSVYVCCYSLVAELCPADKRSIVTFAFDVLPAAGRLLTSLMAYFFREWRTLLIVIFVPSFLCIPLIWLLPESPRWLLVKGRREEAEKILLNGAKWNKVKPPDPETLKNLLEATKEEEESVSQKTTAAVSYLSRVIHVATIFLRTREMRRRSIPMYFCWFILSFVSYGLTFHFAKLPFNLYMIHTINNIISVVTKGGMALYPIPDKIGRKMSFLLCFSLGGVAGLAILAVPKEMEWLSVTLSLTCSSFISMTFTLVYLYTAELFPTEVRNTSIATGSVVARIGGISSPYLTNYLYRFHYAIPSAVFGGLSCLAAVACYFLPETKGNSLPETVEELERMNKKTEEVVRSEDTTL